MHNSLSFVGRFAVIVAGYACAVLAAAFLLNVLILAVFGIVPDTIMRGFETDYWPGLWPSLWISTPLVGILIGYFAFWPALALIALGEYFNKRDSLFYSLGGLAIGIILFFAGFQSDLKNGDETVIMMSIAAAGIIGGFVYWLVAGRWTNVPLSKNKPEAQ